MEWVAFVEVTDVTMLKYLRNVYGISKLDWSPNDVFDVDNCLPSSTPEDKTLWWNVLKK